METSAGRPRKPLKKEVEIEQMRRDFKDHNEADQSKQSGVILESIEALEEAGISYALIGGVAGKELGRPRITHDIDLFVRPDDADNALRALEINGFTTEKRDMTWLYKAWKEDILVDIIFKSSGDIYFDDEVRAHVQRLPYKGRFLNAISPEDFIVIKAAVHQEHIPHHWHDALAVLTEGNIDWAYLLKRARFSPRRVLSLLIYAQSNDIGVPSEAIQGLYKALYDTHIGAPKKAHHPYREIADAPSSAKDSIIYTKAKIIEALNTDERIADHDIKVTVTHTSVDARGEVFTREQKEAIREVVEKISPDKKLNDYINVRTYPGPESSEVIH